MFILIAVSVVLVIYAFLSTGKSHTSHGFDAHFFTCIILAGLAAILPVREILLERKLGAAAEEFLGKEQVIVDCKPYFDFTFFAGIKGYVFFGSDTIYLEARTCQEMGRYLRDPEKAGPKERLALHVLTHEAQHVAGTFDEIRTDCEAYQRNHRMSAILGVPKHIAITHARQIHRERSPYHEGYYSAECEPGRSLDENLPDAVWIAKGQPAPPVKVEAVRAPDGMMHKILSVVSGFFESAVRAVTSLLARIVSLIG